MFCFSSVCVHAGVVLVLSVNRCANTMNKACSEEVLHFT